MVGRKWTEVSCSDWMMIYRHSFAGQGFAGTEYSMRYSSRDSSPSHEMKCLLVSDCESVTDDSDAGGHVMHSKPLACDSLTHAYMGRKTLRLLS